MTEAHKQTYFPLKKKGRMKYLRNVAKENVTVFFS